MIGLQSIKADIKEFIAITEMNKTREEKGLGSANLTLHSLFLGNPGTGKTTVARIVGEVLSEKGIIKENKLIETSRSDLVGQYVGATALKTREVLESALGGVLFIDEAYTLANGSANDFGLEAVNEILKFMEDHRDNIVIIFAGYTDEMKKFLELNEGLKSRIPNVFTFEDYTPDELFQIGLNELHGQNYEVDETDYRDLIHHNFELSNDFSNGRWVRNLNERIIRKLAVRLYDQKNADMSKITTEDLLAVKL
jgi:stage V sporulation protein K